MNLRRALGDAPLRRHGDVPSLNAVIIEWDAVTSWYRRRTNEPASSPTDRRPVGSADGGSAERPIDPIPEEPHA